MDKARSTHKLDAHQLDQALAILEKEQQANVPSRWQKIAFIILKSASYGLGLVAVAILAFDVADRTSFIKLGSSYLDRNRMLFSLAIFFSALYILVLLIPFVANVPLLFKLRRQHKLVKRLGLWEVLNTPWQVESREKRSRTTRPVIIGSIGLLIIFIEMIIAGLPVLFATNQAEIFFTIILILLIPLSGALRATYFIIRGLARMEAVTQLQASLSTYKEKAEQDKDGAIDVPSGVYQRIAQIEKAQITRDRAESILAYQQESDEATYIVQKSRAVREAQAQLDPMMRLRVQDRVDALAEVPRPAGAVEDPQTQTWRLRVPDTPIEIEFAVDNERKRVRILSLQTVTGEAAPADAEPGG